VPQRALGRTQARRTPFAVLVLAMLVAGVVGLLMFNTHMQQSSFTATALQDKVTTLTAKEQSLNMELDQLRDPQRLAKAAKQLRMVAPSTPAFLDLSTGRILGTPTAATSADAMRINPLPAQLPKAFARKTVIVKAEVGRTSAADTRAASAAAARATGRKKASTSSTTSTTPPADSGATR
jgi:cell division protein FtsB